MLWSGWPPTNKGSWEEKKKRIQIFFFFFKKGNTEPVPNCQHSQQSLGQHGIIKHLSVSAADCE